MSISAAWLLITRWLALRRLCGVRLKALASDGRRVDSFERQLWVRSLERLVRSHCFEAARGIRVLLVLGLIMPLVGLAGSVVGLTNAFRGLSLSAGGGVFSVSAGIGEALDPLAVGLAIGLVCYLAYVFLVAQLDRRVADFRRQIVGAIHESHFAS